MALNLRDPGGAQRFATAVSTPGSDQHRQFLSNREFTERFGPSEDTIDEVSDWLRSQGLKLSGVSANRQMVAAVGKVKQLESVFDVTLSKFRNRGASGTRVTVAPDRDIAVPSSLRGKITGVVGLSDADRMHPNHRVSQQQDGDQGCARHWGEKNNESVPQKYPKGRQSNVLCGYDYEQTRSIYDLDDKHTGAGQRVGIVGAYNSQTTMADANLASVEYGAPTLPPNKYHTVLPDRFVDDDDRCDVQSWRTEQAMDVQAVHTAAPEADITYYGAKSCISGHMYEALNKAVEDNKVSVISNSWGAPNEADLPPAAHRQFGQIAVQAAAQGQALLFSSGDAGDNSGLGKKQTLFPAASPWVTAAGGTTVGLDGNNETEFVSGWQNSGNTLTGGRWKPQNDSDGPFAGGAGGGASTYYDQPDYQKGVVPDAQANGKRAVPDIAALSDGYTGFGIGYTTAEDGFVLAPAGGTSLAAPLLAGMVADAQQVQQVKRMGFLNPALYGRADSDTIADVTPAEAGIWTRKMSAVGDVDVPDGEGNYLIDIDDKPQSLQSARGWDPVTGIGTPTRGFVDRLGTR